MSGDHVVVTVGDAYLGAGPGGIDAVADRLRAAGMQVDQVLATIGVITGSAPPERHGALAGLPGVAGVESGAGFALPPPDSDIQ